MAHSLPRGPQTMSGKKRHWFQLHLSTAILLMTTAAALLGMNLIGSRRADIEFMPSLESDIIRLSLLNFNRHDVIRYGWPVRSRTETIVVYSSREQSEREGSIVVYSSRETLDLNQVRTRWPNVFAQLLKYENE